MGFTAVARHAPRQVTLYRQGDVDYLVNEEPAATRRASSRRTARVRRAWAGAWPMRARRSTARISMGAEPADPAEGAATLDVPAIKGIGGSLIYFIDRYGAAAAWRMCGFEWLGEADPHPAGAGLFYIDHLTHNVQRGRMGVWSGFYERLFNFREIRFFAINGEYTGLHSRALTSPDGRIRIPINESADDNSQIEEYLHAYNGEGIQHIACGCHDVHATIEGCAATACRSCRRRPSPISSGSTPACRAMARTSRGCSATAS